MRGWSLADTTPDSDIPKTYHTLSLELSSYVALFRLIWLTNSRLVHSMMYASEIENM